MASGGGKAAAGKSGWSMFSAVRFYVDKLVKEPALEGGKVLLLDANTTKIVSMVSIYLSLSIA